MRNDQLDGADLQNNGFVVELWQFLSLHGFLKSAVLNESGCGAKDPGSNPAVLLFFSYGDNAYYVFLYMYTCLRLG